MREAIKNIIENNSPELASEEILNLIFNQPIKIELKYWSDSCGDGCCHDYGTCTYLNDEHICVNHKEATEEYLGLNLILKKIGFNNLNIIESHDY